MKRSFERYGLGYVMRLPDLVTEISVGQLYRKSGDLSGTVMVECALAGTRSSTGRLFAGKLNFAGTLPRKQLASYLADRAGGPIDGLDWAELLEDFCGRVLHAERAHREVVPVGDRPARIAPRWQLAPILPWRKTTNLYGAGGTGKSTIAVAVAVSIQTGITVIPGWTPSPTNVLYLDWETDEDDIDEKVKAIARGAGIEGPVTISYLACHGRSFADQVEGIAEARQETDAGFVVVDSVMHASGTSTSEGADAAETTIRLYNALSRLESTVLLVDHVDKASVMDPTRQSRPYGSISKENMARQQFEVRRSDAIGDRSEIVLFNTKSNRRKIAPIGLVVEQSETGDIIRYERQEVKLEEHKSQPLPARIDSILKDGKQHWEQLAELLDEDGGKVRSTLSRGRKNGRYVSIGEGEWGLASHAG